MNNVANYIDSGVLELYVMGIASPQEIAEVEKMAAAHPEVAGAIREISIALESYAGAHAVTPHATVKPLLLATIDYMGRLQNGEAPAFPPVLGEHSSLSDYREWLDREDLSAPAEIGDIHLCIIGYTPQVTTAIVWIKNMAPHEVHDNEYERFLIVEGTCDIVVDDKTHKLTPGDYMQVPLHSGHYVKVTSDIPCKVILQRVAA